MLRYRHAQCLDSFQEERSQARGTQCRPRPSLPLLDRFALGVSEDIAEDVSTLLRLGHFRHADHHRTTIPRLSQLDDELKSSRQYASGECRVRAPAVLGHQILQAEKCLLGGFSDHREQDTVRGKQKMQQRYSLRALHFIENQTHGVHLGHQCEKIEAVDAGPAVFWHRVGSEGSDPSSLQGRFVWILDSEDLPVASHVGNKAVEKLSLAASWRATDSEIQPGREAYRQELESSDCENAPSDQTVGVKRARVRRLAFANTAPVRDHTPL